MNDTTKFAFGEQIKKLSDDQKLEFYVLLAHYLTVKIRFIWSDEELTASQQVELIKWVNEIQHRLTGKLNHIGKDDYWDDETIEAMIVDYCQQANSDGMRRSILSYAAHLYQQITTE